LQHVWPTSIEVSESALSRVELDESVRIKTHFRDLIRFLLMIMISKLV
jgi:hypothetical protein